MKKSTTRDVDEMLIFRSLSGTSWRPKQGENFLIPEQMPKICNLVDIYSLWRDKLIIFMSIMMM